MDMNLVVLRGTVCAVPEEQPNGRRRTLITVREESPRRVEVIPVLEYEPTDRPADINDRLWVVGSLRRVWTEEAGRKSKIEVRAEQVVITRMVEDPDDRSTWVCSAVGCSRPVYDDMDPATAIVALDYCSLHEHLAETGS